MKKPLQIVIPMAGSGSRFAQAGYELPKPLIDVDGQPMITRVIANLRPGFPHRFIFLVQSEHLKRFSLIEKLRAWGGERSVCVPVEKLTEGAACTVLLARDVLDLEAEMVIANSDQLVDFVFSRFVRSARDKNLDGSILVFPNEGEDKWSFAKVDEHGMVVEVAEKRRISNLATVGIYYYAQARHFISAADQMISKNIRTKNEFYVCPVYNEMILNGAKVGIYQVSATQMHGLGTPEDLNAYLQSLGRTA